MILRTWQFLFIGLLFISQWGFAQDDNLLFIKNQFERFHQQNYTEKVYAHTDKNFYVAGEILWFKIYLVDGNLHLPGNLSKVVYVDVISSDQKMVLQAKIDLYDSKGNGSFLLPATINSGNFLLRAYTNWMKNSDPSYYFYKQISIVNTFKKPDWKQIANFHPPSIQFFPEGGNLVAGLKSRIAFKATDSIGSGIACSGIVVNSLQDTVAKFQSRNMGMGYFDFTPVKDESYRVISKLGSYNVFNELPEVYNAGIVMTVNEIEKKHYSVEISSSPSLENMNLYLLVSTRQSLKTILSSKIINGSATFKVMKDSLGDGLSLFTIMNEKHQPLCERLIFKYPEKNLKVNVLFDTTGIRTRQKIDLTIQTNNSQHPVNANLSMSVFLLDSLQEVNQEDIDHYYWLRSDLTGKIENPAWYFDSTNKDAAVSLDNLVMTQGWRRFSWDEITKETKKPIAHLPEYEGQLVTGKVVSRQTGLVAKNIPVFVSLPGKTFGFKITQSDSIGRLIVTPGNYYGTPGLITLTTAPEYDVVLDSSFTDFEISAKTEPFILTRKNAEDLIEKSIGVQTQHTYITELLNKFSLTGYRDTLTFYGIPDKNYFLDDYTRFTTMEEVLREYVTEVRVRKSGEQYHLNVQNTPGKYYFEKDPLVLLDGIAVNITDLMNYNPLQVQKIEVVARKYYTGNIAHEGIVSFFTYDGFPVDFDFGKNVFRKSFEGLQAYRQFYSPIYEDQMIENKIPDFRNVLIWEPDIFTIDGKAVYSFFSSELTGKYAILLQGITSNGVSGGYLRTFTVY